MNIYEMIPMTYPELKVVRSLVEGARGKTIWASLELDSLAEKLDAARKRAKRRMFQELKAADAKGTR